MLGPGRAVLADLVVLEGRSEVPWWEELLLLDDGGALPVDALVELIESPDVSEASSWSMWRDSR